MVNASMPHEGWTRVECPTLVGWRRGHRDCAQCSAVERQNMKAVVFELDGALIDSERDLYAAANCIEMIDHMRQRRSPRIVEHEDLPDTVARSVVLR